MSHNNNPYSAAADAYGKNSAATSTDQRSMEGQALMKAAQKLEALSKALANNEKPSLETISEALDYNRKLWTIFAGETGNDDHPLPHEIKNNIANISVFIFKRTIEIQIEPTPEKIEALIDINRQIASGLMQKPPAPEEDSQASATDKTDTQETPPPSDGLSTSA